ncbi:MAG: HlyD family type I secretion periplasmic adaptor subunit [Proteobacteria bacterium]|nr:HlyD family type I secretion periplasmic adaptor subunit [Pseudomonadota bacterium]
MSGRAVSVLRPGGGLMREIRRPGQLRHLSDSVLLEEAGSPRLIRAAMLVVFLLVAAVVGWSAVSEVDEVAVSYGQVVPSGSIRAVQHLEGGIVAAILVRDGDFVEEGQVLVRLDPSSAQAELEQTRARWASLALKAERLRAFATDTESDFSFVDERYRGLVEDQKAILAASRSARASKISVLEKQIQQRRAELAILERQRGTVERQIKLFDEEMEMRKTLVDKGLNSRIVYLNIQREVNKAQGDLARVLGQVLQVREAAGEVEKRLADVTVQMKEEALSELGTTRAELAQVREALAKVEDRARRLEVRSPVRGVVKGLAVTSAGGVIAPGQQFLEVVPVEDELIVESRVTPRDVGHVSVGQPVTVKIAAYDFARYGAIPGTVRGISASTFAEADGQPYYKARIALARNYVGDNPRRNLILPGMTAQADIDTGQKTILQYLLKPIYVSVEQAFRER